MAEISELVKKPMLQNESKVPLTQSFMSDNYQADI